jgi:hypothetical protein
VIGQNCLPALKDQVKMLYTGAVIHETQSYSDIAPIGIPHCVIQDTHFQEYFISKVSPAGSQSLRWRMTAVVLWKLVSLSLGYKEFSISRSLWGREILEICNSSPSLFCYFFNLLDVRFSFAKKRPYTYRNSLDDGTPPTAVFLILLLK